MTPATPTSCHCRRRLCRPRFVFINFAAVSSLSLIYLRWELAGSLCFTISLLHEPLGLAPESRSDWGGQEGQRGVSIPAVRVRATRVPAGPFSRRPFHAAHSPVRPPVRPLSRRIDKHSEVVLWDRGAELISRYSRGKPRGIFVLSETALCPSTPYYNYNCCCRCCCCCPTCAVCRRLSNLSQSSSMTPSTVSYLSFLIRFPIGASKSTSGGSWRGI